jgi:hypothetical protein
LKAQSEREGAREGGRARERHGEVGSARKGKDSVGRNGMLRARAWGEVAKDRVRVEVGRARRRQALQGKRRERAWRGAESGDGARERNGPPLVW